MRAARALRRSCWSIPTASWSTGTATASSTKAADSCTKLGNGLRAISISRRRARLPTPSSTAGCSTLRIINAPSGPTSRRCRPTRLAELAERIGVDAGNLGATIAAYNAACRGDPNTFDATRCDGLAAARDLQPPKSNWARAINVAPFLAYPLAGAVAYTFGGLATDDRARVLRDRAAIPGLFAAGEITGNFYATAPNAVSVMRAFVFGRIAGREAIAFLQGNAG